MANLKSIFYAIPAVFAAGYVSAATLGGFEFKAVDGFNFDTPFPIVFGTMTGRLTYDVTTSGRELFDGPSGRISFHEATLEYSIEGGPFFDGLSEDIPVSITLRDFPPIAPGALSDQIQGTSLVVDPDTLEIVSNPEHFVSFELTGTDSLSVDGRLPMSFPEGVLAPNAVITVSGPRTSTNSVGSVGDPIFPPRSFSIREINSFSIVEPVRGESEDFPVLPEGPRDETGRYILGIPVGQDEPFDEGELVWFDPPVTTGYEYEILGPGIFDSLLFPSLGAVNDIDGYTITAGGVSISGLAGTELDLRSIFGNISSFTLSGIDEGLLLNPDDPLAFPLALSFFNTDSSSQLAILPIVNDEIAPVPLPAGGSLLFAALLGLGWLAPKSRKQRSKEVA